ncbi:MAG TPA: tetratricopeptide repeat protein [Planctomycetota bacterium]|nr:tetratricopeptide repeat protein [Planctomycetota bacterium]
MRALRLLPRFLGIVAIASCSGVSLRPEVASREQPAVVQLTDAERADLAAHVDRAVDAAVRRRYVEAETEANAALGIDPRAARARAVLAMVLLQRAKLQDPPDSFAANAGETESLLAERLAPKDAFVGWMRAVFLAEAGHMSAAAAAAEAALARTTAAPAAERAALLGAAGTYRYELGEERAALPHLQAYVGLRPDDASATFRIGWCLLRIAEVPEGPNGPLVAQQRAEAAAKAFARCVELAPGDEDAALAVGAAYLRAAELAGKRKDFAVRDERRTQADRQFREVAARFPGNAEAMFRLAVLAEHDGQLAEARAAYEQALQRDPRHLGSLLNLAAMHDADGHHVEAEALLTRALRAAEPAQLTAEERSRIEQRLRSRPPERP